MKNKKTIVAIIAVLLVVVVGVTFAYFQSTADFENLFNVGIYKVTTTEVFESPSNWAPGQEIPKTITTTNEGTIPAAVRVSYTEQWLDGDTDITSSIPNGTVTINLDNTSDWTKEGNYYYYNYILEPEQTTSSFMKSVTLSSSINGITCTPSNDGLTQSCESSSPIQGATYKLTITKETVQADSYQEVWNTNVEITEKPTNSVTYLSRQVAGQITPGDVVGIGETEDFYVISTNAEKTVLLAKYAILVGYNDDYEEIIYEYSESDSGYGLQNADIICDYNNQYNTGVVSYMKEDIDNYDHLYWCTNDNLNSEYNENNSIYFDDTTINEYKYVSTNEIAYPYVYDINSDIYPYISGENGYVNRLKEMGAPNTITGRLLSYYEAESAKNIEVDGKSIIFSGESYWLGNALNRYDILCVGTETGYEKNFYSGHRKSHIRPVIEIPTSALQ